jgi:hypothetical protein
MIMTITLVTIIGAAVGGAYNVVHRAPHLKAETPFTAGFEQMANAATGATLGALAGAIAGIALSLSAAAILTPSIPQHPENEAKKPPIVIATAPA